LELSFVKKAQKVAIDGFYHNSSLCYGIGAHINDLIVDLYTYGFLKPL